MAFNLFPDMPFLGSQATAGFRFDWGIQLPPTANITAYVRSAGKIAGGPDQINRRLFPSVEAVLATGRVQAGDVIAVLPGHTESLPAGSSWATMPAGVMVLGMGDPRMDDGPRINFSNTASSLVPSNRGIIFRNLRMDMDAVNVVAGIAPVAPEVKVQGCFFLCNSSAGQAVNPIDINSAAADRFECTGNWFSGALANPTTGADIRLNVATAIDTLIAGNIFLHGAPTTTGFIAVAGATTGLLVLNNIMYNPTTASTACISIADVASDGFIHGNFMGVRSGGTSNAEGILVTGTTSTIRFGQNQNSSDARASGVLSPAAAN